MHYNCFLNGRPDYIGSIQAGDLGEALEKTAEILRAKGFDHVNVEHSLDAVYFWGWECENDLVFPNEPEGLKALGYCSNYISIAKPFTFDL